jgi:hypothetical protein
MSSLGAKSKAADLRPLQETLHNLQPTAFLFGSLTAPRNLEPVLALGSARLERARASFDALAQRLHRDSSENAEAGELDD